MTVGIRLGGFYYANNDDAAEQAAACERCAELQRRQRARDEQHEAVWRTLDTLRGQLSDLDGRTSEVELAAIEHGHAADTCPTLRDCASVHASTGGER
jgi:ABC-type phosphate transport system auxiliary subunit